MSREPRVAVIGAGSWGTTVASIAARHGPTVLWARRPEVAEAVNAEHVNPAYLPGITLPETLEATSSLERAVRNADVLVMGVPSHGFRAVLGEAVPHVRPWIPVVSLSKGLEQGSRMRMTQVVCELLPGHPAGVLAGPNLAREVMEGYAAAAVVAMADESVAEALQSIFRTTLFRVYTSHDVLGVEIAGALKNVFAIAAGMAVGLGTGDNTRAMVLTRSLAELSRLGEAMGGDPRTFAGLAGMGDLLATCISPLSRNRFVGEQLALGRSLDEITGEMNMVAEGVKTCRVVMQLAEEYGVPMPIAAEVDAVVNDGKPVVEAYRGLARMKPTHEIHGVA